MLSKSERDAIRAREQAATKGPWEFQESQGMDCRWLDIVAGDDDDEILSAETAPRPHIVHASGQQKVEMATQQSIRNLEFCAHARADIPALLDDLDAKDALLAERDATIEVMRKALRRIRLELLIPAAEYVPAIPACVEIAEEAQQSDVGAKLLAEHAAQLAELSAENQRWMGLCTAKGEEIARVTEYRNQMRVEHAAQLAAYRKALARFTVYLPSIARHHDDARVYIFPFGAHCPTVGDFRYALTLLQSPDPGKALLEAHAAELGKLNDALDASESLREIETQALRQQLDHIQGAENGELKAAYAELQAHAGDIAILRQALIETGRTVGCSLADEVSTAFIVTGVPAEAKAVMQAHAAELAAVGEQLESDRTKIADCLTKANLAIDRRHWLTEGRGSYEWNDDRWHDEFRQAAIEIKDALAPLTKIAADWKDCPQTGESVARARLDLQAEIAALRQRAEAAESALLIARREQGA